jgi:hypothetical protein
VIAYASHLPRDPSSLTSCYTSAAAGAHHLSFAGDDDMLQQKLDKWKFNTFAKEEQAGHSGLRKIKQVEFYGKGAGTHIKFFESLPDVCLILSSFFLMKSWTELCLISSRSCLKTIFHRMLDTQSASHPIPSIPKHTSLSF